MIRFDKLKIVSRIEYIKIININAFLSVIKDGKIVYYKYTMNHPYSLMIMVNYKHNELVLEFSGKILLDRYSELINHKNIEYCLNNINEIGICKINIKDLLLDSQVVKCDVTKDIVLKMDIKDLTKQIRVMINNYEKWKCNKYKRGICIYNTAKTARYKNRIIIYDKEMEMARKENQDFINEISNRINVLKSFRNIKRFELNINTIKQIKKLLEIPNNNLLTVLSSSAKPILTVLNKALIEENEMDKAYKNTKLIDLMREALLEKYKFDLEKIEMLVRAHSSKTTSIKNAMRPFIELMRQTRGDSNAINLRLLLE